jgi:enoyl-CoA hydratase/carnithine racemase
MAESSEVDTVLYEATDRIATITLNRPNKLNAFDDNQVRRLAEALRRFDIDPAADVAILCGRGRAFSSGADVQQRQLRAREEFERLGGPQAPDANAADLLTRAVNWKPVIAAAHGYAIGLGLGLLLECDLIVAEQGAKFQITETGRGLGGSRHWGLLQSRGGGIINRLAPAGRYLNVAMELARDIVKLPPLSVRATVRTRRWYMDQLSREISMQTQPLKLYLTEDFQEAARAFAEKRPVRAFKGR